MDRVASNRCSKHVRFHVDSYDKIKMRYFTRMPRYSSTDTQSVRTL